MSDIGPFIGYPEIKDIFIDGGIPGVSYAYICTSNQLKAQSEGWETTIRTPAFAIEGPKGAASCLVMAKGKPVPGANRAWVPKIYVDPDIEDITGNKIGEEEENKTQGPQAKA